MSLRPQSGYEVPSETARVARAVFPKGNAYMDLYDTFGDLFENEDFAPSTQMMVNQPYPPCN